jgi:formylglycine-generating enzyme required for sulfatase activity
MLWRRRDLRTLINSVEKEIVPYMQADNRERGVPRSLRMLLPCLIAFTLCPILAFSQDAPASVGLVSLITIHAAGDSFTMGDGTFGPNVTQTISADFSMAKYLITNSQFAGFIAAGGYAEQSYWTKNGWLWKGKKTQPLSWTDAAFNGPNQPVVGVSWYEAVAFCNWLSVKEGLTPAYDLSGRADLSSAGYRLPTEVEWEYAASQGSPGTARRLFPWGDTWDPSFAVCQVKPSKATRTANVGSKSPQGDTPQGLADMAGNVWEWMGDNKDGDKDIARAPATDRYFFENDSTAQSFVLRGGSWVNNFASGMRCSFRSFTSDPGSRINVYGFRVVRR